MPTAQRPVAELAAEVCDHCGAPSHVNLAPDSISNRFSSKQKGAAGSGCGAGLVAAIGTVGAQIAYGIVRGSVEMGYAIGHTGGTLPPGLAEASPHWLVFVLVALLTASGLYFLFRKSKAD